MENAQTQEYSISKQEMDRRKKANLVLTFSLTVGFFLGLFRLWYSDLTYVLIFTGCCFVAMYAIRILSLIVLNRHLKTHIILTDTNVQRITNIADETILYRDIRTLYILYTTRGDVRHVKITTQQGNIMVLNGMNNFQQFVDQLKIKVHDAQTQKKSEPIDYDHPLFYYILGLVVGFLVTFGMLSMSQSNTATIKIATYVFSGLAICLGLYFLFGKPLKKWYGGKSKWTDALMAIVSLAAGILVLILI